MLHHVNNRHRLVSRGKLGNIKLENQQNEFMKIMGPVPVACETMACSIMTVNEQGAVAKERGDIHHERGLWKG